MSWESDLMKTLLLSALLLSGTASTISVAADDSSNTGVYVKDSVLTTKVKTKLVAKHPSTLSNVRVDTDKDGVVWLSGTVPTRADSDTAETIARETDGVRAVRNKIVVE
jgi:hyperosmotically inducible periplasmic protein